MACGCMGYVSADESIHFWPCCEIHYRLIADLAAAAFADETVVIEDERTP